MTTQSKKTTTVAVRENIESNVGSRAMTTSTDINAHFASLFINIGARSIEASRNTSKETLSNLRAANQGLHDPFSYVTTCNTLAKKQMDLLARVAQEMSDIARKVGSETKGLKEESGIAVRPKVATTTTDAPKKVAPIGKETADKVEPKKAATTRKKMPAAKTVLGKSAPNVKNATDTIAVTTKTADLKSKVETNESDIKVNDLTGQTSTITSNVSNNNTPKPQGVVSNTRRHADSKAVKIALKTTTKNNNGTIADKNIVPTTTKQGADKTAKRTNAAVDAGTLNINGKDAVSEKQSNAGANKSSGNANTIPSKTTKSK